MPKQPLPWVLHSLWKSLFHPHPTLRPPLWILRAETFTPLHLCWSCVTCLSWSFLQSLPACQNPVSRSNSNVNLFVKPARITAVKINHSSNTRFLSLFLHLADQPHRRAKQCWCESQLWVLETLYCVQQTHPLSPPRTQHGTCVDGWLEFTLRKLWCEKQDLQFVDLKKKKKLKNSGHFKDN